MSRFVPRKSELSAIVKTESPFLTIKECAVFARCSVPGIYKNIPIWRRDYGLKVAKTHSNGPLLVSRTDFLRVLSEIANQSEI